MMTRAALEENGTVIVAGLDVAIIPGVSTTPYGNRPPDQAQFKVPAHISVDISAQHKLLFDNGTQRVLHITAVSTNNVVTGVGALQVVHGVLDR